MRRLHHGHSMLAGGLMVLLLERHMVVFVLLIFAAGVTVGRTWLLWLRVGESARRYFDRRAQRVRVRVRAARTSPDEIPF